MLNIDPLTGECATVWQDAQDVCIGVSPFNSYFSAERLLSLASWGLNNFRSCHFFIPDETAAYTLEAMGYAPNRARQKAWRQGRYVVNKVHHALATLEVEDPQSLILDMGRLHANAHYHELLNQVQTLFDNDRDFQEACVEASNWVLDRRLPDGAQATDEQLRSAVRYLLAELPLFAGSAQIVGQPSSMFVYHQRVTFLESFFKRELSWEPNPGQGFLVVTQPEDQSAETLVGSA